MDITKDKEDVINLIIEIEQQMFLQVKVGNDPYGHTCQKRKKTFQLMRWMTHSVLSHRTLLSYLSDLQNAQRENRNLMTEKYALMDDLIPHPQYDKNPIEYIVEKELVWMEELCSKYPWLFQNKKEYFKKYMISEYETYSERTLESLKEDVMKAERMHLNLPEMRYKNLFRRLGYDTIDDAKEIYNKGGYS